MERKKLLVIVEPTYVTPVWFAKSILGLQETTAKQHLSIHFVEKLSDLSDFKNVNSAIVISSRTDWTKYVLLTLGKYKIKPILIGTTPSKFGDNISAVVFNHRHFIKTIVHYLYECGRHKLALVGVNSNSSNDSAISETFLSVSEFLNIGSTPDDIFPIDDDIINPIEAFCANAGNYNGAVCPNDYIAVCLLEAARRHKIKVPEELYVVGMGNMLLGLCSTPSLTTFSVNYYEVGVQAVHVWEMLESNPSIISTATTLNGEMIYRGSTAYAAPHQTIEYSNETAADHLSISMGTVNFSVRCLENCLLQCDQLDFKIIGEIIRGNSFELIANNLFISQGTLRYRLKKMYQAARISSRLDFESLLRRYVTNIEILNDLLLASSGNMLSTASNTLSSQYRV